MKKISSNITDKNKYHFKNKLETNCDDEHLKNIKISDKIIYDEYGRSTFYYVTLANHIIPIYQPGTVCFVSAVKNDSGLVVDNNGQQNGVILGNGCALFLARVTSEISINYKK